MRAHARNQGLKLKQADRAALEALTHRGRESVRVLMRARALQLLAEGWTVVGAAEAVGVTQTTVRNVRRRYLEEGLGGALHERPRPGAARLLTERQASEVVAMVCAPPPEGRARWTVRLIAEEAVRRGFVAKVGRETVRELLLRHDLKPWREKMWCVPKLDAQYIERMEDVLELYARPLCPEEPVVCFDERPVQLLEWVRPASPACPGREARQNYAYFRCGTANLFCAVEPKEGWHFVKATSNRKSEAFAEALRDVANHYPSAETIHLVLDNLSTHSCRALEVRFGVRAGRRLWRRFTVHFTPVHGSWLNQAEIEISLLSRQCLGKRRIPTLDKLDQETDAWDQWANHQRLRIYWRFTIPKARAKFGYDPPNFSRSED